VSVVHFYPLTSGIPARAQPSFGNQPCGLLSSSFP
jgi:hypothetical protein